MLQFILLLATAVLVGIDQLTKYLVTSNMQLGQSIPVIDGVFELLYHRNPGAAFGILPNQRWIFITFTFIVMLVILVILMSGKFRKYKLANAAGVLILAGGIGNMIDRLTQKYVVDFLYFKLINFPIFNVADCYVTIAAACCCWWRSCLSIRRIRFRRQKRRPCRRRTAIFPGSRRM